jgi:hypothetical protein
MFFLKKVWRVRRSYYDPLLSIVSSGCFWALFAWGIYAATSDAITSHYPRYLLFYLVVLVDRASFLAKQQEELQVYDEEPAYLYDNVLSGQFV